MGTLSSDSSAAVATTDVPRAHLFLALACTTPLAGSSRHALEGVHEVHLGRGLARSSRRSTERERSILRLAIPDERVSTSHARLTHGEDGWTFEDRGSKNGSFVNGANVRRALLGDGDILQVGHTFLLFRASLATPPNAAADVDATVPASAFATLVPALARDFEALAAVAPTDIPVLLISETGTGKELVARALHALSRRPGPFVPVNCGALATTLAESILFGHKRGAFSGATSDHVGLLRAADEGTLLLDELGDMPLALQPMLLRALQEREVLPVGATTPVRIGGRFVGATHRDLEARVAQGAFREDLLARLAGFVFRLPPLRERREDLGLVIGAILHGLGQASGRAPTLSSAAGFHLLRYDWPRNARELEKCLTRAALFAGEGPIDVQHLAPEARAPNATPAGPSRRELTPSDEENRTRLLGLLETHDGNLQAVADVLQTSRSQVHRWLRRFAIDVEAYRRVPLRLRALPRAPRSTLDVHR